MMELGGKISDAIRKELAAGKDPKDVGTTDFRSASPTPSTKAIKAARGRGLGRGASRSDHK